MKRWFHILLLLALAGVAQAQQTTILDRPTIDPSSLDAPENVYTLTDDANPSTPVTRKVPLRSVADLSREFMTLSAPTTLTGNEAFFLVVRHSNPAHTLAVPSNQSVCIYNGNAAGGTDLSTTGVGVGTSASIEPGEYAVYQWNGVDAHVLASREPFAVDGAMSGASENPVQNQVVKAYVDGLIPTVDTSMSDVSTNPVRNNVIKAYVDMLAAGDDALDYNSTNPIQNGVVSRSTLVRPYDVVVDAANDGNFATIVSDMNAQGYGTIWIKGTVVIPAGSIHTITAPISIRGLGPDSVLMFTTGAPFNSFIQIGPSTFPIVNGSPDHAAHAGSKLSADTSAFTNTFTATGLGAQAGDWIAVFSVTPWTDGQWHSASNPGYPYEIVQVSKLLGADQYHIEGFLADAMLTPATAVTVDSGTEVFTSAGHGLSDGDQIFFKASSVPGGIVVNTNYFVVNSDTDTFQISDTLGGGAKLISSNGSGVTFHRDSLRPKAWKIPVAKQPGQSQSNVLIADLRIQNDSSSGAINSFAFYNLDGLEIRNVVWERVGSNNPPAQFTLTNCMNVRVHHCKTDGGTLPPSGSEYWAVVGPSTNVTIDHCVGRRHSHMVTTAGQAKDVGASQDLRWGTPRGLDIRNNFAYVVERDAGGGLGGAFDTHAEGWGVLIRNNIVVFDWVSGSSSIGITNRARRSIIKGNVIQFGGASGTGIQDTGANTTIEENWLFRCTRAILTGADNTGVYWGNCSVLRNHIIDGASFGGTSAISSVGGDNNRYLDNVVRGYPGSAMRVQGGDNVLVSGNKFVDCNHATAPLVDFDSSTNVSDGVVISNNEFVNFRVPQAGIDSSVVRFLGAGNNQNIARNTFINCKVTSLLDIEDGTGHRFASNDAGKGVNTNAIDANVNVLAADITIVGNTLDGYGASSVGVIGTDSANITSASTGRNWTD